MLSYFYMNFILQDCRFAFKIVRKLISLHLFRDKSLSSVLTRTGILHACMAALLNFAILIGQKVNNSLNLL